jgi:hypothetical protein
MDKTSFRIALGQIALSLEDVTTIEDVKNVVGDLVSTLDSVFCSEEGEEGEEEGGEDE